jgi:hypothetical protein
MFRSLERRDHRQTRAPFLVPDILALRRLARTDYLRNAGKPDDRVGAAIEALMERRHQNGRWPLNLLHSERIPLQMETAVGSASRWNTLRALRVLRWYASSR